MALQGARRTRVRAHPANVPSHVHGSWAAGAHGCVLALRPADEPRDGVLLASGREARQLLRREAVRKAAEPGHRAACRRRALLGDLLSRPQAPSGLTIFARARCVILRGASIRATSSRASSRPTPHHPKSLKVCCASWKAKSSSPTSALPRRARARLLASTVPGTSART